MLTKLYDGITGGQWAKGKHDWKLTNDTLLTLMNFHTGYGLKTNVHWTVSIQRWSSMEWHRQHRDTCIDNNSFSSIPCTIKSHHNTDQAYTVIMAQFIGLQYLYFVNSLWPSDAIWREIWVNIGSGNGLLPDVTKPLPEPMLTYHHWSPVTSISGQFHERCINHQSLKSAWKLHV